MPAGARDTGAVIGIPELETPRLRLRAIRPDDAEPFIAAMADPGFARYLSLDGKPLSRADAWRRLMMIAGCWVVNGFSNWAVEERASGRFIGTLGPWQPEGWPGFEIGWGIFPAFQGKGYASEGAAAAVRFAHDVLGQDRILHLIAPANAASQGVAQALGAVKGDPWLPPWPNAEPVERWVTTRESFRASRAARRLVTA